MKITHLALLVAMGSTLAACGGGGSGGSDNDPSPTPSSSSAASSSQSSSSAPASSSSSSDANPSACDKVNRVQGFASIIGGTTGGADIGEGNNVVIATTGAEISAALTNATYTDLPLTIYVDGQMTWENSNSAPIRVRRDNVSIIGRNEGEFYGVGIEVSHGASNVIIRNLKMHEVPQSRGSGDIISLNGQDGPVRNIWIDHNELYNSLVAPGCTTETCHKDYHDELVSGRADVSDVTISYNYLHDSWKTSLWGSSDAGEEGDADRRITFHNNYWYKVNSRLPLFRFGEAHIFNNYYHEVDGSGINSRMGAVMRIDGNHFEDVKNPIVSIDSSELGFWTVDDNLFTNITTSNGSCSTSSPPCYNAQEISTIEGHTPAYEYELMAAADIKAHVTENAGAYKINSCLGFDEISSSSSSSSSSVMPEGPAGWNVYNGNALPATVGSVSLANGGSTAFSIGGNEAGTAHEAFTLGSGMVTFDTSVDATFTHHASVSDVVNSAAIYPKYFTLLAGITGNAGDARGLEIEVAMADAGVTGSRVKMLIRPDQGGVQLEEVNNIDSMQSYNSPGGPIDMNVFRVYHLTIAMTSATTGSINVYADGSDTPMPNLSVSDISMRPTSGTGSNYVRIGDGGSNAYKSSIDWLIWSDQAAYTPAQLKGLLPADIGQITGYEPD